MIVLDTHVWVWWVSGSTPLSSKARRIIEEGVQQSAIYLSSISVWEVAQLATRGRLQLTMGVADWVAEIRGAAVCPLRTRGQHHCPQISPVA